MTVTSADGCCINRQIVAVAGIDGGLAEVAQRMVEEVDGLALEAESDVGVDVGGDADVGVAEEFP